MVQLILNQRLGRQLFRATRAVQVDGQRLRAEAGLFHAQQSIRKCADRSIQTTRGNNEMKGGADITQMQMP